jgi:PAS domain S-box-containing protein
MPLCRPLCFFILLAFGPGVSPAHAQAQPQNPLAGKNVLILHAHEANVPVFVGTDKGIATTLESGGISGLNQFFESLDLRRNPDPKHGELLVEQMRTRYSRRKLDMIVTLFPEALEFVLKHSEDIFPHVPILALYLPEGFELPKTSRRIIGHSAKTDILGTFEIALRLLPGAKRVYVVSGIHDVDRMIEDRARHELNKWEARLEFQYLSRMSFDDMLATISTAPPDSVILALALSRDVEGKNFTSVEVAQRLGRLSKAPIFGFLGPALGYGIVGGSLINFEGIGTRAGELILDILRGSKTPESIPGFLDVPPVPMFDGRQLRRWNLNESALPKGSIIINKELTFWDFKYYVIGGMAFIIGQSFLMAGLLIQKRRKRLAEESLWQKTEELDQFFSVTLDLLCIANTDGYFLRLNPAWETILGYRREELMAQRFLDFVHPEDLVSTQGALSVLSSQQKLVDFENRYRCKDGTYRWLDWSAAPAGSLIYASARDITERLKTEAEDRQRREELAHVSRIATMGELIASLAHEINQPLTAILSNAVAAERFLSQPQPDIGEVRQILEDIVRDDRRASDVVRKVRALAKKEKPREEILDLNRTIQEVVGLIRGESVLHGLSITMERTDALQKIRGDRVQLQQVILNLILNSAAAMRNTPRDQRKIIVRTAMADRGTVKASVMDFGTGIDENTIERLFEPFYTTKPEGLGMGLSISQRIIKSHGGTMEASNNKEGGATFAFTLPVHDGGPQ